MNLKIKKSKLIKNSIGESFHLYINKQKYLILNKYNQNNKFVSTYSITKQKLLDFSADIDKNDRIHLIFLLKDGSLVYSIYKDKVISKNLIKKLDTKSNIYKYLNLYIIKNKVNIFYAYANLINKNLWTIEQIIGTKTEWIKKRVNTSLSEKTPSPYYLDYDTSGNIHLIFKAIEENSNHIYYIFYNSFIKKWNKVPEKISSSNINNLFPYLFIDSKNNVHILWTTLNSKNYILNYKKLAYTGQEKYKWQKIQLPTINNITFTPIMVEDSKVLKIIFLIKDKIKHIYSKDYGNSWFKTKDNNLITPSCYFTDYSSNFLDESFTTKANNLYCKINNKISSFPKEFYKINDPKKEKNKIKQNIKNNNENKKDSISLISEIYALTKETSETVNNIEKDLNLIKEIIKNSDYEQKNSLIKKLSTLFK